VPQLDDAIVQTTQSVSDPRTGAPVYDTWKGDKAAPSIGRLGSGSDYTSFLDHLVMPDRRSSTACKRCASPTRTCSRSISPTTRRR